jgi:hypothetical protein
MGSLGALAAFKFGDRKKRSVLKLQKSRDHEHFDLFIFNKRGRVS